MTTTDVVCGDVWSLVPCLGIRELSTVSGGCLTLFPGSDKLLLVYCLVWCNRPEPEACWDEKGLWEKKFQ